DDVPRAGHRRLDRAAFGSLEMLGGQLEVEDPLDLERPDRAARLVVADEVERVGRRGRLDEVGPDARLARLAAGCIRPRVVPEADDATLRPGLREQAYALAERLRRRLPGHDLEGARDVVGERLRHARAELLERSH